MRAALLHRYGQSPRIEQTEVPHPVANESLVEVAAAAVGHLDVTIASGRFSVPPRLPHIGGTDAVGTIVESDRFEPGVRVLVRGGGVGVNRPGCWAEYVAAPDTALMELPRSLPPAAAATFLSPSTSGYLAVTGVARITPGERVLVTGASGAVGAASGQFALHAGAASVTGLVSTHAKAATLPQGVEPLVSSPDVLDRLASKPMFDVLIDTVGGQQLASLLGGVVPGGRAVLIGYTRGEAVSLDLPNFLLHDVALLPLNMMRRREEQASLVPMMCDLITSGRLALPVHEFALHELPSALDALRNGHVNGRAAVVL
ncbi:quinone oxidoreductase family protein [Rhodococcus sp. B50]|jgi:NADPH2:quinone reductase|uniref:quinone oxidoreductase family protein n=1 Tax=Rhodococcus sp. B50 TaxID=2682847 RepID=UPI001BD47CA6|nr:zinc-binding alcohol dehydrogenase family protein [Rhodococcus sp. B50]MBS9373343.1 putative quinone oxidoreductase YhfP [Rhodococcus sp. B50]